jgi:hypothetical protein
MGISIEVTSGNYTLIKSGTLLTINGDLRAPRGMQQPASCTTYIPT